MIQKALAWVQIFVLVGGGLIAWGKMSAKIEDLQQMVKQQHEQVMHQIADENSRILAIEQEVFRVYLGSVKDKKGSQ